MKTDGQDYIEKSVLPGHQQLGAQGRTTPLPTKEDEPLDYFDKSEAEYGRQTPKEQRAATAQM